MKRFLSIALSALLAPALAAAAVHARYTLQLRDGRQVFSNDLPVRRGSVVTFHQSPGGALTGLPAEDVVGIQTGVVEVRSNTNAKRSAADAIVRGQRTAVQTLAQPMQPGDVIILGPTGGGSAQAAQAGSKSGVAAAAPYTPPASSSYGGGYPSAPFLPTGMTANGQPTFAPQPGSTLSAQSGAPPTVGPDGFPVTTGNPPTIGPNGTPISSSDQPVIGANGTPVQPGTSTAAQPVVGSNGTPVMAGTAGAVQPVIGPNGTPVLAPSGAPGSAASNIGPNGTPVLAPAGAPGSAPPATAPNGTPASPPPGGGASPK